MTIRNIRLNPISSKHCRASVNVPVLHKTGTFTRIYKANKTDLFTSENLIFMAEPTLVQIFGANATQNATTITITKADLPGLTASSTNTAESLLTAILLKAQNGLPQSTFDTNIDQSIYIALGFPGFAFRGTNNDSYRVDTLTVNLAKPDTSATIDPNDY